MRTLPSGLPISGSLVPFWRTLTHNLGSYRATKDLPAETENLIIGPGFAGALTAYHLVEQGKSPSRITIVEAREACSGATGRNGGHVKPANYTALPGWIEKYGFEKAKQAVRFEADNFSAVKEMIEREHIDADFVLDRTFDVIFDKKVSVSTKAAFQLLKESGDVGLSDIQFLEGEAAAQVRFKLSHFMNVILLMDADFPHERCP